MPKKNVGNRKKLLIVGLLLLIALVVLTLLEATNTTSFFEKKNEEKTAEIQSSDDYLPGVDYSPATSTDNADINAKKEQGFVDPQSPENNTNNIIVTITRANVYESEVDISVLLSGVSSGECTVTLTNGTTVLSAKSSISKQDQYTFCNTFPINRDGLYPGVWTVNVSVISSDTQYSGSSTTELTI